jgi:hypothetical protein
LLVLGELHGVYETPSVVYALIAEVEARAVAFEWSHEEMDESVQRFLQHGAFDFDQLWALPVSAEFFCGDGRITAGHFALLRRLREEDRLDQVIVFDRLDQPSPTKNAFLRDCEMADRLRREWDTNIPLLVLTGAFHAQLPGNRRRDDGDASRSPTTGTADGDARLHKRAMLVARGTPRRVGADAGCSHHFVGTDGHARDRAGTADVIASRQCRAFPLLLCRACPT